VVSDKYEQRGVEEVKRDFWEKKRVLVTGGAGFIGSNLTEDLVSLGAAVRVVDNLERGKREYLSKVLDRVEFVNADLRKEETCREVCRGIEIVFHLAARVGGIGYYLSKPGEVILQNTMIDSFMVEAVLEERVQRYFYASSAHVYPIELQMAPDAPLIKEEQVLPAHPELSYGWAKLIAEKQIEYVAQENTSFRAAVARLIGVFGKNQDLDFETGSAIPVFIRRAIEYPQRKPFVIWGTGNETRSYCYIDDVLGGILSMVQKLDQQQLVGPLNLGSEERIRIEDLAKEVVKISGKDMEIVKDQTKKTLIWGQALDCSKAKKLLDGWEPKVTLSEGLRWMYEYYMDKT
jgi:GDP-D-mannose 3',5'-epimerase